MAEKKYYVIINDDDRRLIYGTWDEVKPQGHKGVKSISFKDKAEAEYFVEHGHLKFNDDIEKRIKLLNAHEAIIFTDGSFSDQYLYKVGAGAVIKYLENEDDKKVLTHDLKVHEPQSFPVEIDVLVASRNVGGEILAVAESVSWAMDHGINHIDLYHDYTEIGMWATGEHKTNIPLTQAYKKFMRDMINKGLKIEFYHVPAHKGITYNEEADRLAEEALES